MDKEIPGYCICIKCGYSMPAPKGVDCSQLKCPKCGSPMRNALPEIDRLEIKDPKQPDEQIE